MIHTFKTLDPPLIFQTEGSIELFTIGSDTAQKLKLSIKDFFSKCDQIRRLDEPDDWIDNSPWMTEIVKSKLRERSNLVKRYYKNGKKILT